MLEAWADLRAKVTLPVLGFCLVLLMGFVALVAIFSKVFGIAAGAGIMGATAALAFISARSESELEEELEADTQEMLREYALQENQRLEWLKWRFGREGEDVDENIEEDEDQSPRVPGSRPLPSRVGPLREALQARLEALRNQEALPGEELEEAEEASASEDKTLDLEQLVDKIEAPTCPNVVPKMHPSA
ncbi:Pentatricopeptide repeat-containing protein [Durusdinium trenchii]|uniref:Chloroplastic n=1 Tax=Durusdinium trenchii TaxID=1381693 RepID=A0ABP0HHA7_9DINO